MMQGAAPIPAGRSLRYFVEQRTAEYIKATIRHCRGNVDEAAWMLQISVATIRRKIGSSPQPQGITGARVL